MLMRPHDGGIDDPVSKVGITDQCFKNPLPDPAFGPAVEAHVDAIPLAELGRQKTPRRSAPYDPQNGIDKQPVVISRATTVAYFPRNQRRDQLPLRVAQFPANHDCSPPKAVLNHSCAKMGIP